MLSPTRKPIRNSAATISQAAGQTGLTPSPFPRSPIHSALASR